MRQGETLHATESLWRATGRRAPARYLPSPVLWQKCGLREGGAAREANLQTSPFLPTDLPEDNSVQPQH
jgi:hypothetical protein